jgi:hypothetical protein
MHVLARILLLNKGPYMDPMGNQRNNLQKEWKTLFIKNKIIANFSDSPK